MQSKQVLTYLAAKYNLGHVTMEATAQWKAEAHVNPQEPRVVDATIKAISSVADTQSVSHQDTNQKSDGAPETPSKAKVLAPAVESKAFGGKADEINAPVVDNPSDRKSTGGASGACATHNDPYKGNILIKNNKCH